MMWLGMQCDWYCFVGGWICWSLVKFEVIVKFIVGVLILVVVYIFG